MRASELYRRLHFYVGNAVRAATIPWKQHRITPAEATTLFACSFGDHGWHHLRKTLEEYDADAAIDYRDTTLYRYLKGFTPQSIADLVAWGPTPRCQLPLFVYPWGTFREGETISRKDAERSRFCGPSSDAFVAEEFARTIAMYEAMKRTGYQPWRFANTFVGGTMLRASNGERRFVVLQGNHRFAILAHMRVPAIPVRDVPGYLSSVRERDVQQWPKVRDGTCSEASALAIFRLFFTETGAHVLRRVQADPSRA
jgi:hypothetical protein